MFAQMMAGSPSLESNCFCWGFIGVAVVAAALFALLPRPSAAVRGRGWGGPIFYLLLTLLVFFVVPIGVSLLSDVRGEQTLSRLLKGDESVALSSIRFERGDQSLDCDDPEVLRYLDDCFRRCHRGWPLPFGEPRLFSSNLTLRFQGGTQVTKYPYFVKSGLGLYDWQETDGRPNYFIEFREPMPQRMQEVVALLKEPWLVQHVHIGPAE